MMPFDHTGATFRKRRDKPNMRSKRYHSLRLSESMTNSFACRAPRARSTRPNFSKEWVYKVREGLARSLPFTRCLRPLSFSRKREPPVTNCEHEHDTKQWFFANVADACPRKFSNNEMNDEHNWRQSSETR